MTYVCLTWVKQEVRHLSPANLHRSLTKQDFFFPNLTREKKISSFTLCPGYNIMGKVIYLWVNFVSSFLKVEIWCQRRLTSWEKNMLFSFPSLYSFIRNALDQISRGKGYLSQKIASFFCVAAFNFFSFFFTCK